MVISADGARSSDATSLKGIRCDVPVTQSQEKEKKKKKHWSFDRPRCDRVARQRETKRVFNDVDRYVHTYVTLLRISRLLGYAEPWTLIHNDTRYHSTCLHACNYLRIRSTFIELSLLTSSTLDSMFFAREIEKTDFFCTSIFLCHYFLSLYQYIVIYIFLCVHIYASLFLPFIFYMLVSLSPCFFYTLYFYSSL